MTKPLAEATEHQAAARVALEAGVASPRHAYLFAGPRGAGKRRAARAFAAELLATGASDPDDARRRALADPSPHPDRVGVAPPGRGAPSGDGCPGQRARQRAAPLTPSEAAPS